MATTQACGVKLIQVIRHVVRYVVRHVHVLSNTHSYDVTHTAIRCQTYRLIYT